MAEQETRNFEPGDIVRLVTGVRLLVVTGYDADGEVVFMTETGESVLQGTAPECALELLKRKAAPEPSTDDLAKSKKKRKARGKLKSVVSGTFAGDVLRLAKSGRSPYEIATETGSTGQAVKMMTGRLRYSGFLPKS